MSAVVEEAVPVRASYRMRTLRAWRHYLGYGLRELAEAAEVGLSTLWCAETGRQAMRGRLVYAVAEVLGIPAAILVAHSPLDGEARAWAEAALVNRANRKAAMLVARDRPGACDCGRDMGNGPERRAAQPDHVTGMARDTSCGAVAHHAYHLKDREWEVKRHRE